MKAWKRISFTAALLLFVSGCGTFQTPDRTKEQEEDLRSIREVRPWSADVYNPQRP